MRNISYSLTTPQYRAGLKSVTRRLGWADVKRGDRLMGCVKCQGLGPGGKMERIHPCEVVSNHEEPLSRLIEDPAYGKAEAILEGFPELDGEGFVRMFCDHMKVKDTQIVNRIQFSHIFPRDWIAATLKAKTTQFSDEKKLQLEIARAFVAAGIPFEREVKLVDDGIVDFLVMGHVAVEVKVRGSGFEATRQSFRYLEDPRTTQAVIISATPLTVPITAYYTGDGQTKGVGLVELWRNAL